MVALLLSHGADALMKNPPIGEIALHAAAGNDHVEVVRLLIQRQPTCVNVATTAFGCTPLHVAAMAKSYAATRVLLEHGADPNALNSRKEPPALAQLEQEVRSASRSVGTLVARLPLPPPAKAAIFQVRIYLHQTITSISALSVCGAHNNTCISHITCCSRSTIHSLHFGADTSH